MRLVVSMSGLMMVIGLVVMIHCSIINTHIRDSEVSTGLESAMDYATDRMQDMSSRLDFETSNKEEAANILIKEFCEALQSVIGTDGIIQVAVLKADFMTGVFDFVVEEIYQYSFRGRQGKARCQRTVSFFSEE